MGRGRGRQLITGLDVGTTKICCIIAEWSSIGTLDIVGVGTSPSRGLRKGVVVNIDSTVESIKQAVGDAEEMAGAEIGGVLAGVAGGHIRGVNSRGVIAVSGKHREVSQADVDRALDAARAINLPQDREIIHALPQTYVVDDQDGVKEPIGMSGVRLEVEVHLVTGATTSVRNVVRSVNRAGLQVQDIVLEPLASAEAVLSDEEKELGILLIDLGGGTTDVALFRDGAIWHTGVLPLGGDHISNDVAVGLRTTSESPPTPVGRPRRTGRSKTCSASSGTPGRIDAPPVTTTPAAAASSSPALVSSRATRVKISSTRGWMISERIWRDSSRALRPPTDGTEITSSSRTSAVSAQPWRFLSSSASEVGVRSPTAMSLEM